MSTKQQKPKRNIVCFEPCGPVAAMLANAAKGKTRGAKTRFIQTAIAEACKASQPKLYETFKTLLTEDAI